MLFFNKVVIEYLLLLSLIVLSGQKQEFVQYEVKLWESNLFFVLFFLNFSSVVMPTKN